MSLLIRKLAHNNGRYLILKHNEIQILVSNRNFSIVPTVYDGPQDPAPKFFSPNVQDLLKRLTRPDYAKVFRKRTNSGLTLLKTPTYKFLTDQELEAEKAKAAKKANRLLQMPPIVKLQQPIDDVLSKDPALVGFDTATYLFTDITFGVKNEKRIIVQRDTDGSLRCCDNDIRKKLNQAYFPMAGRKSKDPTMFTNEERFNSILDAGNYEFILDRACVQYEPDEPAFHRITSITYQHVDANKKYDILRSTRHFGPLTFYLTWHQTMDNLMLELLQTGVIREAVLLVALRQTIHGDVADGQLAEALVKQILPTPVQLTKLDILTEEDISLDQKCMECIESYITKTSSIKSQQELALQGFRENYQQHIELSRGLQKAHGNM